MASVCINLQEHEEIPLLIEESMVSGGNGVNLTRGISGDYSRSSGEEGISRTIRSKRRSVENVDELDYKRLNMNNSEDGLYRFKTVLFSVGLHDSSFASLIASWTIFLIFTLLVPIIGVTFVTCSNCKSIQIQLDIIIQISESSLATISFLFLSHNVRKHGLKKILFLDKIGRESRNVKFTVKEEYNVCATVQVTGFALCLHGAARITHRAQRVVSIASQWHALVTCQLHDISESETENMTESHAIDVDRMYLSSSEYASDVELDADVLTFVSSKYESSSFQKRQAAVSYMQHSNAGISIYGFVLDRGFIYALFGLELSLVLFILGLTI